MSLSVPALLDAAATVAPRTSVRLPGQSLTLAELDRASARIADSFLGHGWAPGDRIQLPDLDSAHGLVAALGAVRIGVLLGEVDDGPIAHEQMVEREVAESHVWSETILAELTAGTATHGDVVNAVGVPEPLAPLVDLVQQAFDRAR